MSLAVLANHLASKGRGEDSMLVHMTPKEVAGLHSLALAHGGSLTINPDTGLPEAGFLSKILPAIAGMALNFIAPGVGTVIGEAILGAGAAGAGALGTGIAVGGITGLATGSLQKGLMAGLGAYGGASLGAGLAGAGESSYLASGLGDITSSADAAVNAAQLDGVQGADALSKIRNDEFMRLLGERRAAFNELPAWDKMSQGVSALKDAGGFSSLAKPAFAAFAPMLAGEGVKSGLPATVTKSPTAYITPYGFDPRTQSFYSRGRYKPEDFPGFENLPTARAASGGIVALADGGDTQPLYQSLTSSSTPEQIAAAYNQYVQTAGGDTAANQQAAMDYLSNLGVSPTTVQSAYDVYTGGVAAPAPAPYFEAAPEPTYEPLYQSLTSQSTPEQISAAYNQYTQSAGGDTAANQQAAMEYLSNLGVAPQTVQDAYTLYTGGDSMGPISGSTYAPALPEATFATAAPAPAPAPAPLYQSLTQQSTPEQIAAAYREYTQTAGGDTQATQQEALKYLQNLGVTTPTVDTAYDLFLGRTPAPPPSYLYQSLTRASDPVSIAAAYAQFVQSVGGDSLQNRQEALTYLQNLGIPQATIDAAYDLYLSKQPIKQPIKTPAPPPPLKQPAPAPAPTQGVFPNPLAAPAPTPYFGMPQGQEQAYTQNTVYSGLQQYLRDHPNATYSELTDVAKNLGVPLGQLNAAINETRFNQLTGGSKAAYDYLMGRGAYPVSPTTVNKGPIAKPYWEAVGMPAPKYTPNVLPPAAPPGSSGSTGTVAATGSWKGLTAGDKMALQDALAKSQSTNDYSTIQALVDAYKLSEGDVLAAWPQLTAKDIAAYKNMGIKFYVPPAGEAKNGGLLAAYAYGGRTDLGGYSDGGRLLRGPGDGVSDSIPATIGGKQPARLADGEFVVPARIVSELGNGSTEAGARKLYAMMDRVQKARNKTTGEGQIAKNTRAEQYLPA